MVGCRSRPSILAEWISHVPYDVGTDGSPVAERHHAELYGSA